MLKKFLFIVALVLGFAVQQGFAYDDYFDFGDYSTTSHRYKNISFAIKNPSTAKGKVYMLPTNLADTAYCKITKQPTLAKVEGNMTDTDGDFKVNLYVCPADGYVLDVLTTDEGYRTGKYRSVGNYIGNTEGYAISSVRLTLDDDTVHNVTKSRPAKAASYKPYAWEAETYAIFVPAKKMTVKNKKAGQLASIVKAGKYGEATNDLVVTGPLNGDDMKYLNELSKSKGLIRLDLSGATFTTIPDSAFYGSGLYELKLPSKIEAVGSYAFANSRGLKPVKLPSGIVKGSNITRGCELMALMGESIDGVSGMTSKNVRYPF